MTRMKPLPPDHSAELQEIVGAYMGGQGYVPNSILTMQRRPRLVKAVAELVHAVWESHGSVSPGFKRLIGHFASRSHGCQYCMAHTAAGALRVGVDASKLEALWEYQSSPLFTPAERVALDFALAAAAVPNAVDDALFERMRRHWSEDDIVEITAVVAMFGFMNRWNDSLSTPLEKDPTRVGEDYLAQHGWTLGKHG